MIPYLSPLKESIWLKIIILSFGCGFVSLGSWLLITKYLPVSDTYTALSAGAFTLAVSVLTGKYIANRAVCATDFLARAILLATRDDSQAEAPLEKKLSKASKSFLTDLSKRVYELASAQQLDDKAQLADLQYFKNVVNSIPLPLFVLNKDRELTFANEAANLYIGMKTDEIINQPIHDVLDLSFVSSLTLEVWLNECSQKAVTATETWERVRLLLPDGKRKQFDLSAYFSSGSSNEVETVLVLYDRTVLYERDDHALTFISLAVHELRTPLTAMRGYIEVFEKELQDKLSNEQKTFMHNMSANAQQLSSYVSSILNIARIEENALNLRLKEENWPEVLNTVCQDMILRAKVHGKKITVEIEDNLPTVAIDKISIFEVVTNIIDNAIKYTHTDEEIKVHSYLKDDMIETTITDKGVGIPSSVIEHVFDKFYRAHHSKNSVGGTGLGLYLCRIIVNAHGGQIWVNSKEGKGSTFGFSLPTYASVADQIKNEDNKGIVRGAHGWIKNHSIYRE